ncbi:MAG TPA: hypothetical protein VG476_04515 [Acidimicrobiales bacterium]|nr:hypothetical protein [Acidimicrobiales bacterium]
MTDKQGHSELYRRINSFEYRWGLVADKVARLRAIVAQEQFVSAARVPKSKGRGPRERRIAYWADVVAGVV